MKRKISFVFAAAIAILSLTGCGSGETSVNESEVSDVADSVLSEVENTTADDDSSSAISAISTADAVFDSKISGEETLTAEEQEISLAANYTTVNYTAVFEVLPAIDETPVSMFTYKHTDDYGGGIKITGYSGSSTIRIPETIDGEPVVDADLSDSFVTELIIPGTLQSITVDGQYLQYYNITPNLNPGYYTGADLKQVYIQDGVTEIDDEAFYGCTGLTTITIPDSVTHIASDGYRNDSDGYWNDEADAENVEYTDYSAFAGCENIKVTYKGKTYTYDDIYELYDAINS